MAFSSTLLLECDHLYVTSILLKFVERVKMSSKWTSCLSFPSGSSNELVFIRLDFILALALKTLLHNLLSISQKHFVQKYLICFSRYFLM